MRFLGGYVGGLFMGAAKVLGEEGVQQGHNNGQQGQQDKGKEAKRGEDGDAEKKE